MASDSEEPIVMGAGGIIDFPGDWTDEQKREWTAAYNQRWDHEVCSGLADGLDDTTSPFPNAWIVDYKGESGEEVWQFETTADDEAEAHEIFTALYPMYSVVRVRKKGTLIPDDFSREELKVLGMLDQGLNRKAIADQLVVYKRVVDNIIESICIKLDVDGQGVRSAVKAAREKGILE